MLCDSCEVLYINGVKCHEQGCPDAWKDYERECTECGGKFKPDDKDQLTCDDCYEEENIDYCEDCEKECGFCKL